MKPEIGQIYEGKITSITNFGAGVLVICAIMLPIVDIIKDNGLILDADDYIG